MLCITSIQNCSSSRCDINTVITSYSIHYTKLYEDLAALMKTIDGARWSPTLRAWYLPKEQFDLHRFFETFRGKAWVDYRELKNANKGQPITTAVATKAHYNLKTFKSKLTAEVKSQILSFKAWMEQKRYAPNTINTYIHQLEIFFGYYADRNNFV